ncbi:protein-tyrosine-phosphatase [Pontibacter sp. G13]|uniref:protein-tyrosine-phosphatase n=1 Tax=Pontibacter sp. G13 TaxID=3074898 RepID=UPI002888FC2E|nr:protein-tyrosine-phosphatase [Pontibacter sp. G13]WNJ16940.1 protein-tyrosine-phosphatase [Pontibacter sp. G13]
MMYSQISTYIESCQAEIDTIDAGRKADLDRLAQKIADRIQDGSPLNLLYICTHNSRRSHFGQVWGKVMAAYMGISGISSFSGGTETTACHPNSVAAIKRVGFQVDAITEGDNPHYEIRYDDATEPMLAYSKVFHDPANPQKDFFAIMTCSSADAACPFVPGADFRIPLPYDDPKAFDGTDLQDAKYDERCRQIATEHAYMYEQVSAKLKETQA